MSIIIQGLGGLGLFLLGMVVMTEGLKSLAGVAIRNAILRFTRTPLSGAVTGALGTALLQSSSATTVAAVGFVGASLMAFPEALGIVFGANIGTTVTGWLVALLGFKLQLGTVVLPVIFLGALLRLFGKGRVAATGYALAGFGLIFVGISVMQQGMAELQGVVTPATLPADSITGRIQLLLIGMLITIITQSSSAGVAAALTALYAGTINFHQAASLVIGMDVGTTITALFATIGGSVGAKRTGYSHFIYNIMTGTFALLLISPFVWLWTSLAGGQLEQHAEIALVAFHSSFNLLGVMVILPFTRPFARMIERLVPERIPVHLQKLDSALLSQPGLALNEVQTVLGYQLRALLSHMLAILDHSTTGNRVNLQELQVALDTVHAYIDKVHLRDENSAEWERLVELIHTMDHMQRLHERCEEDEYRAIILRDDKLLDEPGKLLLSGIQEIIHELDARNWHKVIKVSEQLHETIEQGYASYRQMIVEKMGRGEIDAQRATQLLEAIRWMRRVIQHIKQINRHYSSSVLQTGVEG